MIMMVMYLKYTVLGKKGATRPPIFLALTLPDAVRLSKFFHRLRRSRIILLGFAIEIKG